MDQEWQGASQGNNLQHSDDIALGPELIHNPLFPPFDRTDRRLVNLLFAFVPTIVSNLWPISLAQIDVGRVLVFSQTLQR